MGKFEEYNELDNDVQRKRFALRESTKKLDATSTISGPYDQTFVELRDHFNDRLQNSTYLERTKYYFESAGIMEAKAKRYRKLADDGRDITAYANQYGNHSARKRKKSANAAADAFDKAALLEELLDFTLRDAILFHLVVAVGGFHGLGHEALFLLSSKIVEGVATTTLQFLKECRLDNLFHVFLYGLLGMEL